MPLKGFVLVPVHAGHYPKGLLIFKSLLTGISTCTVIQIGLIGREEEQLTAEPRKGPKRVYVF